MTVATRGQKADQLFATMLLLTDCNATRLMCTRIAKERQLPLRASLPSGKLPCCPTLRRGKPLVELGHVGQEQGCPEGEGHALRRLVSDLLPLLDYGVKVARE